MPRVLGSHAGAIGSAYRHRYTALVEALGPFASKLERLEAGRVASLGVQLDLSMMALVAAQRSRASGKGRRPGVREIERLSRRAGLADGSYSQALDKLRDLVGGERKPQDLARQLAAVNGGARDR